MFLRITSREDEDVTELSSVLHWEPAPLTCGYDSLADAIPKPDSSGMHLGVVGVIPRCGNAGVHAPGGSHA